MKRQLAAALTTALWASLCVAQIDDRDRLELEMRMDMGMDSPVQSTVQGKQEWRGKEILDSYVAQQRRLDAPSMPPSIYKKIVVGELATLRESKVLQILDPTSALIKTPATVGLNLFRLDKFDFSKLADDSPLPRMVVKATGTYRYETVSGGESTIYRLEPAKMPAHKPKSSFPNFPFLRVWKNEKHGSSLKASYAGYGDDGVVTLMTPTLRIVKIDRSMLSGDDKRHITDLLKAKLEYEQQREKRNRERR